MTDLHLEGAESGGTLHRRRHGLVPAAVLAACLAGAGCSSSETGPCSSVACSGHGVCASVADFAYCVCAPGFHPRGLECQPNDPVNPCLDVTCSDHGSCFVEGEVPVCSCADGYRVDPVSRLACLPIETPEADVGRETDADAGRDGDADVASDVDAGGCGDGRTTGTEECDDGNRVPGDGCEPDCRFTCHSSGDCDDGEDCTEDLCGSGTHRCENVGATDGTSCSGGYGSCCGGACRTLDSDPENCSACGNVCPGGLHAVPVCAGSWCDLACDPGYQDRDGSPGCEFACGFGDPCNLVDDDCDGATDEDGCPAGSYCQDGGCWPMPQLLQGAEPLCIDLGVPNVGLGYTITGRPGATAEKWNAHTSCGGAATVAPETTPPVVLDAAGSWTFRMDTGVVADCAFEVLGSWSSWAQVDLRESGRVTTVYYNSGCPGLASCSLAAGFCP
jgi:hypothetical protein